MENQIDFNNLVVVVSSAIGTIAIVAGAAWGYYRHRRSRSFEPRLTLRVSAHLDRSSSENKAVCALEVNNVGLSKVDIKKAHVTLVHVPSSGQRNLLKTLKVLREHSWIEPGATVIGQESIPCAERHGTVEVKFRLVTKGRLGAKPPAFTATSVLELPKSGTHMEHGEATSPT